MTCRGWTAPARSCSAWWPAVSRPAGGPARGVPDRRTQFLRPGKPGRRARGPAVGRGGDSVAGQPLSRDDGPGTAATARRRPGEPARLARTPGLARRPGPAVAGTLPAALPLTHRLQTSSPRASRRCPPRFELLLLAALDGTGDLRLIRAIAADRGREDLSPAERAGLVRADETTAQLTFRHPLIRSALVELSTSEQRRQAHAELAARLANQPERHAWHLAEATVEPDEEVAALLQEVAHANLRRGDSVGAVTELLRAAELSPSGKGRSGRLAEAAYLGSIVTGDLRDAPRLLEQARRAYPAPAVRSRRPWPAPFTCSTATATSIPPTGC